MKFIFSLQYSNNYKINEPNLTSKKINSPNITIIDLKANIIPANIFPKNSQSEKHIFVSQHPGPLYRVHALPAT